MHPSKLDSQGRVVEVTFKTNEDLARSAVGQSAMGSVVIVLPQVAPEAFPGFVEVLVLRQSDFFLLRAAMEALDVAVSFRVMVGGAPMGDPQPGRGFQEAGGGELRAIVPSAPGEFLFVGVTAGQAFPWNGFSPTHSQGGTASHCRW